MTGLTGGGRAMLERARDAYADRFDESMSAAALAGFSGAWALLGVVAQNADSLAPEAIADSANRTRLPIGSLPNGSGLQFGGAGTATAGANVLAASVVWQWQGPGAEAAGWPPRYATSRIEPIDPLP